MTIQITPLAIPDVKLIVPQRHGDARGYFCETWNARTLAEHGVEAAFVQDNQSYSAAVGTIRGLHWQNEPHAQGKLVRALRGRIFDVAVDIRPDSNTFGCWVSAELSAENGAQLWIPAGFAHGFCTLEPESEVFYKTDGYYCADDEGGLRYDDPSIGIQWPLQGVEPVLSERDQALPTLRDLGILPGNAVTTA